VLEDDIKAVIKPQYVDHIPKAVRGNVEEVLDGKDQRGIKQYLLDHLDLTQVGQAGSRRGGGGRHGSAGCLSRVCTLCYGGSLIKTESA
jgi:ATP-binding cassette subfamily E protein 1